MPNAPNTVLMSHGFWTRQFGAAPDVVGQSLSLNGVPHTVIGVMPPGFRPPFVPNADIWTTFQFDPVAQQDRRGNASLRAIVRLRDGVSLEAARAAATALGARLEQEYPQANTGVGYALFPLRADITRAAQTPLWVLLGAVGFVLLIACVNIANLLLARMNARHPELAVRAALGAGRRRLVRQLLTENAVLAVGGGLLGIVLAVIGTRLLVSMAPSGTPRIDDVTVDMRVLAFAVLVAGASTFIFGLLPALRGGRTDLVDALKGSGRGADTTRRGHAVGNVLVVSQVALALVLLVGSGLMIRSMRTLNAVNLGFEPHGLLAVTMNLPQTSYPDRAATYGFYRDLESRLASLPGVEEVGSTNTVPLAGQDGDVNFVVEGRPLPRPGEEYALWLHRVTPTYFETIGTRIVRGRAFTPSDDSESPRVLIVNQTLAARFFPNEEAVGKRINVNSAENPVWREIVGVAEDIKNFGIRGDSRFVGYFPFAQIPTTFMSLLLRTSGDPTALIASVRAVIAEMDPSLAATNIATMDSYVESSLGPERFVTLLLTLFAALALVLASVGLYGVVSYGVSRRVQEMGIRIALGAAARDIWRMVIGKSVRVALLGVAVGVVGGLLLTRTMSGLLFGVSASDPVTFGVAATVLTVVSVIASAIPARRAVNLAPMTVLKKE